MHDILIALIYALVGATMLAVVSRWVVRPKEHIIVALGFVAHVVSAYVHIWVTRHAYGWGDALMYQIVGKAVANTVRLGPDFIFFEVIKMLFQQEFTLPIYTAFGISATSSMFAVSALINLLCYDSEYAVCTVISIMAFGGKLAMYVALRRSFSEALHQRVLIACTLVPSSVYWSSGILKEAVAMAGFGWLVFGTDEALRGRYVRGLLVGLVGSVPIALVKPYWLPVFVVSACVWFYWRQIRSAGRSGMLVKAIALTVGAGLTVGAMVLLGSLFPRVALDDLGDNIAQQQYYGGKYTGGSSFAIGDPTKTSLVQQIAFIPAALIASLFRPFIFEASNPMIFANALETTVITVLIVRLLLRVRLRRLYSLVTGSPILMFCLAFSVTCGAMVGLTTPNLGSLSRYRMPLVPLYAVIILTLDYVSRGDNKQTKSTSVPLHKLPTTPGQNGSFV